MNKSLPVFLPNDLMILLEILADLDLVLNNDSVLNLFVREFNVSFVNLPGPVPEDLDGLADFL